MSHRERNSGSEEPDITLAEFLRNEGAIGILVRLDGDDGMINKTLQERVHVVSTTLSNRLAEALDLELVEVGRNPSDHGNAKRYWLTQRGDALRRHLVTNEVDEVYAEFFELNQRLESEADGLVDWALDQGIDDPRWPGDHERDDDPPWT